ncbi:MAG: hypothetical protein WC440_02705 [Candidatus Omnitrophota bacterium]|jgi:ABC-type antimicrobial peptide transport system permease subunit
MKLDLYSYRNYPKEGWAINGRNVLPPSAYMEEIYWLNHILSIFPKLKTMDIFASGRVLTVYQIREIVFKLIQYFNQKTGFNN